MFDIGPGMFYAVLFHPLQNRFVLFQTMHGILKHVTVNLKKAKEMFIEPNGLVIVAVEKSLPVQLRLVDQAREMNVAAELFVRTARMQSSHGRKLGGVRRSSCAERNIRPGFLLSRFHFRQKFPLSEVRLTDNKLS